MLRTRGSDTPIRAKNHWSSWFLFLAVKTIFRKIQAENPSIENRQRDTEGGWVEGDLVPALQRTRGIFFAFQPRLKLLMVDSTLEEKRISRT